MEESYEKAPCDFALFYNVEDKIMFKNTAHHAPLTAPHLIPLLRDSCAITHQFRLR